MTTEQTDVQIEELERRIRELEDRINRWAANGLGQLDRGSAFAGSGGLYGTAATFARSDHT